jgi:phage terminase large subunit-like protein
VYEPKTASDLKAFEEGAYYDDSEPQKIKRFIEKHCRLSDGKDFGQLSTVLPWVQKDILEPFYGLRKADGTSQKKRGSIWIPKKNAKTTSLAFLSIYELLAEKGAEVYVLSSCIESAGHLFKYAANAIDMDPVLSRAIHVQPHKKELTYKKNKSFLKVLSGSKEGRRGQHSTAVFVDELADITDDEAWNGLYHSGIARPDNWKMIAISTPQYNRRSLAWEEFTKARGIIDGSIIDTEYHGVIYGLHEDEPYDQPELWWKHIPCLGMKLTKEYYLHEFEQVRNVPSKLGTFRAELLGQWVDAIDQFFRDDRLALCYDPSLRVEDFRGCKCWIGIDASRVSLSAYVLLFERDSILYAFPRFFYPIETAREDDKKVGTRWMQLGTQKEPAITLTEGSLFDAKAIASGILNDIEALELDVAEIRSDNYGHDWINEMLKEGSEGQYELAEVDSTARTMTTYLTALEQAVGAGTIKFASDVLLQNFKAVTIKTIHTKGDPDAILIDRDKSTGRYDGVSALLAAMIGKGGDQEYEYTGVWSLDL